MKERGKKVLNFLLLRPAFTGRNLFSIFLVMLFFGVYIASGGRIHSVPKIQPGGQFGTVDVEPAKSSQPAAVNQVDQTRGIFEDQSPVRGEINERQTPKKDAELSPAERLEKLRQKMQQSNQK